MLKSHFMRPMETLPGLPFPYFLYFFHQLLGGGEPFDEVGSFQVRCHVMQRGSLLYNVSSNIKGEISRRDGLQDIRTVRFI